MSGGSYEYLCHADSSDIGSWNRTENLKLMIERLKELGYDDVANESQSIFDDLARLDEKVKKLSDVWQSVEWVDSCDWGKESIDEAVKTYRKQ